jgi:hypothetical protein
MLSRALSLATVTLLIGCLAMGAARVQAQNLEAGKSPSQIFAGTCNACHKSPRGLLKSVPASSLPGFLRQHYTTSSEMASVLSSYLVSNGATDTRYQAKDQPKQGKDAKQEAKPAVQPGQAEQLDRFGRRQHPAAATQEASRPDVDGLTPQGEAGRAGRNAKRLARPAEVPDATKPADGQTPAQAATDTKPGARQKLSKRGRPGAEEPPKPETAGSDAKEEAAKGEAGRDDTSKSETAKIDAAKGEGDKAESAKPAGEGSSEAAKVDAPRETGGEPTPLRPDPVPPVTPAPAVAPPASTTTASGTPEPATSPSAAAPSESPTAPPAAPAVTASAPPLPPVAPAGPPAPPISK